MVDTAPGRKGPRLKTQIVKDFVVSREKLGSGSFATVYKGWRQDRSDEEVAVKAISLSKINPRLHSKIDSEIVILKELRHPNVVGLHDVKRCENYIILVLEYCSGGDLSRFIKERRRPDQQRALEPATALTFMRQLAQGLHFLHSRDLVHRDIKPQNLLLSSPDPASAVLKIADFGFARYLSDPQPGDLSQTLCGSPMYMAPEILDGRTYGPNVDLWSAGAVLYEMLFGEPPFRADTLLDLQRAVRQGPRLPDHHAETLDPQTVDLLRRLLQVEPGARLPWPDFFRHPAIYQGGMYGDQTPVTPVEAAAAVVPESDASPQAPEAEPQAGSKAARGWGPSALAALIAREPSASISAETQTSPVQAASGFRRVLGAQEQADLVADIEATVGLAAQLAGMGRQAAADGAAPAAFLLLERALRLLCDANRKMEQGDTWGPPAALLRDRVHGEFADGIAAAAKVGGAMLHRAPGTPAAATPAVEQLIFAHALQAAGGDGAVEEMLGNVAVARAQYEAGHRLLRYLLTLPALGPGDRSTVQRYLGAFDRRLRACADSAAAAAVADRP